MKTHDQIGIYVPVSVVFPGLQNDIDTFRSLLSGLSRTDTLFWCARLNLAVSANAYRDNLEAQQFGLNQFFTSKEIETINDFVLSRGGAQKVKIFFRGQLLELFRWVALYCADHPADGRTFEDPKIRHKFAQAALIASDIWAKRIFEDKFSLDGGIEISRKRALGSLRKSVEAIAATPELSKSLGRGWALFKEYFPKYYQSFDKDFSSVTGISLEQYFCCFAAIITKFADPRNNPIFNIKDIQEHIRYGDEFWRYLELESQSPDELVRLLWNDIDHRISRYDDAPIEYYRPLREKPILRTTDDRGIIIDPIFYNEKASIGPLFHILKSPQCKPDEAFSAFGKAFEEYTLDILGRMFTTSSVLVNRFSKNIKALDNERKSVEIDALLNDIFEVVLFEIKSAFIPERDVLSNDYKTLLEQLRERYSVSGRSKLKGVGQIARVVTSLATRKWTGNDDKLRDVELIYPVLIVHDALLTLPVYGNFFASEFETHLKPDTTHPSGIMVKGAIRVIPLIVMSIDDLEDLETSVEHFGFRELLADYSNDCPDRLMSLHTFIALTSRYRKAMYHNRNLAAKGIEIMDKCSEAIFGKKFHD